MAWNSPPIQVFSREREAWEAAKLNAPHSTSPTLFSDADAAAAKIIDAVGKTLIVGIPLGLGKPNHLVNALVKRASEDSSISLKIFTALTLEKPAPSNELQRRFIGPVIDRLFGGYPELTYAERAAQRAPCPPISKFTNSSSWPGAGWASTGRSNPTSRRITLMSCRCCLRPASMSSRSLFHRRRLSTAGRITA